MSAPSFACPECRSAVTLGAGRADCAQGHTFPEIAGIIDFRAVSTGFDVDADRIAAEELDAMGEAPFADLLRAYWRRQPAVDPRLVERFVHGDLIGDARATEVVHQIEEVTGRPLSPESVVLEVGSGTAALGAAIARCVRHVVATDISLAWLVLARRRLLESRTENVTLIAATADHLPFVDATFDLAVAADVIEHVPDPKALVAACFAVLSDGGALWLSTPNRLSLTPEPHVRLWGIGWLPRTIGRQVVRRLRGVPYDDIRTLSLLGLGRALAIPNGYVRVVAPGIARSVREGYPPISRWLIDVYEVARRVPVLRALLLAVTPLFHAVVVKDPRAAN